MSVSANQVPTRDSSSQPPPRFALRQRADGVWLEHDGVGPVNLGPLGMVCDELCRFLEEVEYCD